MKRLLVLWGCAVLSLSLNAASPRLSAPTPAGAQRGTELELRLSGSRLDESPEIVFSGQGIAVRKIDSAKTNSLRATIRVAGDCPLGEHQLRVRTSGGVSELRTFWVGTLTNLTEVEPNSERGKAQRVPYGVTINGTAGGDDTDFFRIEARSGQRISAEVEAVRLGRAMLDAYLAIRDADGQVLAAADDTTLLMQDAFVSVVAPKSGVYFIELRDGTYSGTETAYRLHIGGFPRPSAVFPLGGKTGDKTTFSFTGAGSDGLTQQVLLPNRPSEKFGLFAEAEGQLAPSPNWIRVSDFASQLEQEPNDTRQTGTPGPELPPLGFDGRIDRPGDEDYFRFTARQGQALEIQVFARRLRSPLDSILEIFDAKGTRLDGNEDGAGVDSVLKFTPPADGAYVLRVRDQYGQSSPEHGYRVEVVPQRPKVQLSIPQVARNDSQSRQFITVPRGGRFATMVSAKRINYSGELRLQIPGLPPGVKMLGDTLAAKLDQMPVVFEAAADAPIQGRYVEVSAESTKAETPVQSSYRHDLEFIAGPNNTYYYPTHEEKLYVAVCEAAPFSIHIEEPKAPLVSFGALDLKIIAERKPGFDEPINVKMMWTPPGVGSLPDITIPKGSNAAIYQLNAKAEVEARPWKIAVLGSAGGVRVNGERNVGAVFVSSQLATLETAEPYVIGTMAPVQVSPGQEVRLVCKLEQKKPFAGRARVRVLGLPEKITASEAAISSQDKEVVLTLKIDAAMTLGSVRNFICAADIVQDGQVIPHNLANGAVIRVVPPKKGGPVKQVAQSEKK